MQAIASFRSSATSGLGQLGRIRRVRAVVQGGITLTAGGFFVFPISGGCLAKIARFRFEFAELLREVLQSMDDNVNNAVLALQLPLGDPSW